VIAAGFRTVYGIYFGALYAAHLLPVFCLALLPLLRLAGLVNL